MASHAVVARPAARSSAPSAQWRIPRTSRIVTVDALEREADQVAERIVRSPASSPVAVSSIAPAMQKRCACERSSRTHDGCPSCARKQHASAIPDIVRTPGQPLDRETRAFFEPRFGHDFSRVRVHDDSRAAASAASVDSLAYTVGDHVVFSAGRFEPHTAEGRLLIGHELTHVLQQRGSAPAILQRKTPPPPVSATTQRRTGTACDTDQQRKIDSAASTAAAWLRAALQAIDAFIAGAKTKEALVAGGALNTHFHVTDPNIAAYVRARLQTIQADLLSRANLTIECPPGSDWICGPRQGTEEFVAVVPPANPNQINLCGPFFERSDEDDASTLVHELGHAQQGLTSTQHPDDRGYKSDVYYFYLSPAEALTNAESYAMFTRQVATGSTPAQGFIADYVNKECPDAWSAVISEAMVRVRAWNHRAAVSTPKEHRFSKAYKTLDVQLERDITFRCITDGGGRCSDGSVTYWYAAGDLRVCPSLIALRNPETRALEMLASLYAYKDLISGDARQNAAASEARDLFRQNTPSLDAVLTGTP